MTEKTEKNAVLRALGAVNRLLEVVEKVLVAGAVIVMAADLAGNFISRNLFNYSWTFSEEVGSFMLIILTFIGTAYCARMGRHIRMSALIDPLPHKVKKILTLVICIVSALILFYLGWLGVQWVMKTYTSNKVSSVLRFPMYIVYISVPFGFFMAGLQYIFTFIKNLTDPENIYVGSEAKDEEKEAFRVFNEENREILRTALGEKGMEILYALEEEKAALLG